MHPLETLSGIDISEIFAPIYWGLVVSLVLCGFTIIQGYIYFSAAQKDSSLVRFTAMIMLFLDLVSSALISQSIYYYLIPNFGSLLPLNSVTPGLSAECLASTMITFISQMYFVYQLYVVKRLDKERWLVLGSITLCATLAFAGGIACVASMYVFHRGVLANRNGMFAVFFGVAKGFGAITDVLATLAMCLYLSSSRTGIAETNTLLTRLVAFVIHRGALVTLIQLLLLITFYAAPRHLYWLAFHMNVTKLYANTFFAMLNAKNRYKERRHARSSASVLTTSFSSTANCQKLGGVKSDRYDFHTVEIQGHDDFEAIVKGPMPTVTKTVEVADI